MVGGGPGTAVSAGNDAGHDAGLGGGLGARGGGLGAGGGGDWSVSKVHRRDTKRDT